MSSLKSRTITSVYFVLLMLISILWSPYVFAFVFLIVTIMALLEYYHHLKSLNISAFTYTALVSGSSIYCLIALIANKILPSDLVVLIIPLLFIVLIAGLYQFGSSSFSGIVYTIFGIIYIAIPFAMLNLFYNPRFLKPESSYELLLGYFIILWIYDSAAYLLGSRFGKHKLVSGISPNKSWEGLLGGFIFGLAASIGVSYFFNIYSLKDWFIIALILIITGTLGDLFESVIKRNLGVKDTGNILPGHGGILDRFDAVLFSAPFVYFYVYLIQ